MYYVYVLQSDLDKTLYVGYSTNLRQRVLSHNNGMNKSTKGRIPWKLIFYEAYFDMTDAKRRESYLKTTKGKTTLRTMLSNYLSHSVD